MEKKKKTSSTRRGFLRQTSRLAAGSALASGLVPHVFPGEDNTIRVALIGCGGRGTGAASNALSVNNGPLKLVAMADVFEERLKRSFDSLQEKHSHDLELTEERKFLGFDAYRDAIDCLKPGDVAIFATPPAFRWVHFQYAISKGINVFMEKPVTVDGPTTRKLFQLADQSEAKNLKVGVGLMCRHCEAREQLYRRIRQGEIGDINMLRAYRMHGPVGFFSSDPKPEGMNELLYQVQRFHSFIWASGGAFSDFYIHNIDECCWMKDAWPVKAKATGGRHFRGQSVDQNFDNYSVEYSFADGAKLLLQGRCVNRCYNEFASYAHGSSGSAVISEVGHTPAKCRIYSGQDLDNQAHIRWAYPQPERNPYQLEWNNLIAAIREDKPFNEARRGAVASLVTSMGRMAAHTGQIVTYEQALNSPYELAPGVDKFTMDSPAPLAADAEGRYPWPQPGRTKDREY